MSGDDLNAPAAWRTWLVCYMLSTSMATREFLMCASMNVRTEAYLLAFASSLEAHEYPGMDQTPSALSRPAAELAASIGE